MKHHLKHMVIGAAAILTVLLLLKVDLRTALHYALLLACPLGMVGMMLMMNRGGHGRGAADADRHRGSQDDGGEATDSPPQPHPGASEAPRTREDQERIL